MASSSSSYSANYQSNTLQSSNMQSNTLQSSNMQNMHSNTLQSYGSGGGSLGGGTMERSYER